ncbi:hypothetical protein PGT21_017699 [Puccinia graminis f. sp. tritici]|uniref:Uncharacterized protein n=1 Tax=Puccinia graminis f. sp. tritici TaxID=56615 RepID=A0A5B0MJE6_PUCGR|nr:hypothetical protein PGT21_017699 [Puccinia graminis f. sp. tritici]KAA1126922.1 hypothetical protein PGTUg99_031793 [Puccinia graminis f. sp. tritici]
MPGILRLYEATSSRQQAFWELLYYVTVLEIAHSVCRERSSRDGCSTRPPTSTTPGWQPLWAEETARDR